MRKKIKMLIWCLILLWAHWGCTPYQPPKFDKLVLRYQDSSVPPKYHRSYTITVSPEQSIVVVDVYGKSLANKTYKLKASTFEKIKMLAEEVQAPGNYNEQANGGVSQTLKLVHGERIVYALLWDNNQKLKSATSDLVKAVKILVPDLDRLLKTPYDSNLG
ncbi:hypothetical protein [Microscilla marina]|uniref:Lipoprotein n=1 Tax=Microscilla marina ATCC 23134 TaxID=313606 RepID=A1ZQ20_MICM2|nr:hypothetical protein [Microscilla marina]EAY27429.1 hypothetical protein M23134_06830 [Microscilla marina ATCC 23134]